MAWKNVLGLDRAGVEAAKGVFVGELVFGEHGDVHEGVAPIGKRLLMCCSSQGQD